MRSAKSPGALAALGALEIDQLGRQVISNINRQKPLTQAPFYATLAGSNGCDAEGITAHGSAPVLGLCRELVAAGHNPDRPLHAYRGDMLALAVRSIGEGAQLRIASHGVGFERLPGCTGGPPVRQNASTVVGGAGDGDTP